MVPDRAVAAANLDPEVDRDRRDRDLDPDLNLVPESLGTLKKKDK